MIRHSCHALNMAKRGNFPIRQSDNENCQFGDFSNPWNFFSLMMREDSIVHQWMRDRGLILSDLTCPTCEKPCKLKKRPRKKDGLTWMCISKKHEFSFRKYSFFENMQYTFQDIMLFIKGTLDGQTLISISSMTGKY